MKSLRNYIVTKDQVLFDLFEELRGHAAMMDAQSREIMRGSSAWMNQERSDIATPLFDAGSTMKDSVTFLQDIIAKYESRLGVTNANS
jgi:hypothetical protein